MAKVPPKSSYKSPKSVAKNQTVPISVDDPRVAWNKIGQTRARTGAEIEIIDFDGIPLINGGKSLTASVSPAGLDNTLVQQTRTVTGTNNNPARQVDADLIIPTAVTDISAVWSDSGSGENLIVTFNWDYSNPDNYDVSEFLLEITTSNGLVRQTPYGSFPVNRTQTGQTVTLTRSLNQSTLGVFRTNITKVCVYALDAFYNKADSVCDTSIPAWILDLPIPVITVTAARSGYNVAYTIPTESIFDAIDIVEYESTASAEPTGVTYSRVYFNSISPANIITLNTNSRWVKARFSSDAEVYTDFCAAQKVKPTDPVTVDTEGPANVATVTTTGGLDTTGTIGFNGFADISWASVTTGGIRGYRIRYRPITSPASSYSYADSPGVGTSYRLSGLGTGLTYEIAVATYDEYNNTSTSYVAGSNVSISGTPFIGTNISTTGFFQAGVTGTDTGTFKFGYGVDTGKRGLVFNPHNYWYIDSAQSASLKVGGSTNNYISWNGTTFVIDGDITARSGSFTGNVLLNGGSLYAPGTGGSASSGIRTIFNSDGIAAYNASGGYTTMLTAPLTDGSVFVTTAANIGGWTINANEIKKVKGTPEVPEGTISLNSAQGYISISNDNVANKTSGINSPANETSAVFWGGADATNGVSSSVQIEAAPFRVNLSGQLFATDAEITGIITATGGNITGEMDVDGTLNVGNVTIKSVSGNFSIRDAITNYGVISTSESGRLVLGHYQEGFGRQVKVARSAQIAGDPAGAGAENSGGLRNIFTSTVAKFSSSSYLTANEANGDVVLLYTP
jgi:hypothetical protein